MSTRSIPVAWLPIVTFMQLGCAFRPPYQTIDDSPRPPAPRSFQTAGPSLPPSTCASDEGDDACTQCQRRSCCNEIAACDANCRVFFQVYQICLYAEGTWSGYGSRQCKNETAMAQNPAVSALVDCFSAQCSSDAWCGTEPGTAFSFPAPTPTVDFSAAKFLESYCNGCHSPGKVGPTGQPLTQFTSNEAWTEPMGDKNWLSEMDYAAVVAKKDIIACGVRADYLPSECTSLPSVRDGFFTKPAKFPPSGMGGYAFCPYTDPVTGGCPQPTPFERARLLSWIAEGAPQ